MGQPISKNKIFLIFIAVLLAIPANFYLLGVNLRTSLLAPDYLARAVNDIPNQAITAKDHRSGYSLLYKPYQLKNLYFRFIPLDDPLTHSFRPRFSSALKNAGFYFLIYYQLARTSCEESGPYHFYYPM